MRGDSEPNAYRCALLVYDESRGLGMDLGAPAICAIARVGRRGIHKPIKRAPLIPFELVRDIEKFPLDKGISWGQRYFSAL